MPTFGKTLRRERRLAEVTATALAARMGISRMTLYVIERSAEVEPARVKQFRDALADLRDDTETPPGGKAA